MESKVVKSNTDGRCVIRINRPEVHNAVDFDVMHLLNQYLDEAAEDPAVDMLVLTGTGEKAFCAGGDLKAFQHLHTEEEAFQMLAGMSSVLKKIASFPYPTAALLNGNAFGGGAELAMACDIRTAVPSASFGFTQGKFAITTGWGGGSLLLHKAPYDTALNVLCSAEVYMARDWYEMGLITSVEENLDTVSIPEGYKVEKEVNKAYKTLARRMLDEEKLFAMMDEEVRSCAVLWAGSAHEKAIEQFHSRKRT